MTSAQIPMGSNLELSPLQPPELAEPGRSRNGDEVSRHNSLPALLVADDEPAIRRLIGLILAPLDCTICEAVDGVDVVEQFRADPGRFRAVLLDIRMPNRTGIEAMRTLLEIRPELPIFLITATAERVPAHLPPHVEVILKPFDVDLLLEQIRPTLRSAPPRGHH